jgi:hypothetical protein
MTHIDAAVVVAGRRARALSRRLALLAGVSGFLLCVALAGIALVPAVASQSGTVQFGEEGPGAGQLKGPVGVAVNNVPSSLLHGDVYVVDQSNNRVDRFSGSGSFQMAWGWGVADGASELQTCTSVCRQGLEDSPPFQHAGDVSWASGVAVDSNEPLSSSSSGDVYVVQAGPIERVEKFGPSGEFLLMFGGEVNETKDNTPGATQAEKDVCVAGEKCKAGTQGSANGQFQELPLEAASIAVGPAGRVYVGDGPEHSGTTDPGRVQVFEASGVWRETISLAGLAGSAKKGNVIALAVDSAGNVFVKYSEAAGVREFEPGGIERSVQFDAGSTTVTGLTVDGSGDLFVGDSSGEFYVHILKYNTISGKVAGLFGPKTVRGGHEDAAGSYKATGPFFNGLAFSETGKSVYASENYTEIKVSGGPTPSYSSVWELFVPPQGPVVDGESATLSAPAGVVLEGLINPEGNETSYHFEYVSDADFNKVVGGKKCEWGCASHTASATVAEGIEDRPASMLVKGLLVSTLYRYRLLASNSEGSTVGTEAMFESLPAASIDSEYATNITSSSATLDTQVNPLGSSTEYALEYGTSTTYEHSIVGSAGEGVGDVLIAHHLQELAAGTTYHYRIVLHNALGTVEGSDRSFTTRLAASGGALTLPDGRAWELVSPANKKGALIQIDESDGQIQAAGGGSAVTYTAQGPHLGEEEPHGKTRLSHVLSGRMAGGGWRTQDLSVPARVQENGETVVGQNTAGNLYTLFSVDLSLAAFEPSVASTPLLSPEATTRTLYVRNNTSGTFTALVTPNDVSPAGALIEEPTFRNETTGLRTNPDIWQMHYVSATPDLQHVLLTTPLALTENAIAEENLQNSQVLKHDNLEYHQWNLYEWSGGRLALVNVLPNGQATRGFIPGSGVMLAGLRDPGQPKGGGLRAVSGDGRRVAWAWGDPYGADPYGGMIEAREYRGLYVRDMLEERTVRVGGAEAVFQMISSDGTKVFYREGGELYVYEWQLGVPTGTTTDITARHEAGEANAGVQEAVSDVSEDGLYVYFVATGVLAPGGARGGDNLYLLHDTPTGWTTTYIATLSPEDAPDWYALPLISFEPALSRISSRVSPDGRYFTFMSNRSLTGYDNVDAVSGKPDEEVYLYDAATSRLVCVSCNPTGARPVGVFDHLHGVGFNSRLAVDVNDVWADQSEGGGGHQEYDHGLAGSIPGWDKASFSNGGSSYQPRYLSDSGRLFFQSPDALVPQATNGLENVYEYEPPGGAGAPASDSCTTASPTYNPLSGGCVNLISSGTASGESVFYDASETGNDVFFITLSKLVSEDYDSGYDVYDAHVCTATAPCSRVPVAAPPCNSGDSCKAAPSPQPALFGAAPSATFSGQGNVVQEAAPKPKGKGKAKKSKRTKHRKRKAKGKRSKNARKSRVKRSGRGGR